jgi:hypothetical protein
MKIGGPKGPKPSVVPEAVDKQPDPSRPAASFDRILKPPVAEPATPPTVTEGAAAQSLAAIASRIRAGEIDPEQAVTLIVEQIVAERAPQLAEQLREQLRRTLAQTLADDPYLASRVRALATED